LQKKQRNENLWVLHRAKSCSFNFPFFVGDPSGLMRDFKGFTSRKMLKIIEEDPQESRKESMLWVLEKAGKKNSNVKHRQFGNKTTTLLRFGR